MQVEIRFAKIRIFYAAFCFAMASLTVVEAPTSMLWLAALGVTEWGYWLAPLPLLAWLPGWNRSRIGRIGAWLGLAAALLLMTPLVRAAAHVHAWPDGLPSLVNVAAPRVAIGTAGCCAHLSRSCRGGAGGPLSGPS